MARKTTNKDIGEYYNKNQIWYNLFWSKNGLHYGFWEQNTKSLSDAIVNTNKFVSYCLEMNDPGLKSEVSID